MAIVGFTFTKMHAERKSAVKGKMNIRNNVAIKNIEKADLSLGKASQNGLRFIFEYSVVYEPKIAEIILEGELIDIEEDKKVEAVLKDWKKDKKIDPGLMNVVLNTVFNKSNLQALILSKDVNLPAPIPLPRIQMGKQQPGKKEEADAE